jgi:hypothetical protein
MEEAIYACLETNIKIYFEELEFKILDWIKLA